MTIAKIAAMIELPHRSKATRLEQKNEGLTQKRPGSTQCPARRGGSTERVGAERARIEGILTTATGDTKEYRDGLLLLSYMGRGAAVIHKLDQVTVQMEDPRLRETLKKMAQFFREQPELAHAKKFRLLDFARNYSMNTGSRKQASDGIYGVQRYCEEHVASQIPQWQLLAKAAGWTPPGAAS